MMKYSILLIAALLGGWMFRPGRVYAQTATPPPNGEVSGRVINQNQGTSATEIFDVMLHTWDADNVSIDMVHARSASDGTFRFAGIALQPQYLYGVMATFEGVTYLSPTLPPTAGSNSLSLDVPVYETTTDASAIQIDQLHVLFNFAEDGLEIMEIYSLSNTGKRTLKDAVKLDDGTSSTLRYPLPADADYVFFQPDEQDRFVKFPGGFTDTSPLLPGQSYQHAVKYLVPYSQGRTYKYTAPLNIKALSFLLPENSGVLLKGDGLAGPEPFQLDSGKSYAVYSEGAVPAGQAVAVEISGRPAVRVSVRPDTLNVPLALGGGLLGLAMIGAGLWWWRNPREEGREGDEPDAQSCESALDELIVEIARLDEEYEQGHLTSKEHQRRRRALLQRAKTVA